MTSSPPLIIVRIYNVQQACVCVCVGGGGGGAYLKNLNEIILKCLNDTPWKLRRHKGRVSNLLD